MSNAALEILTETTVNSTEVNVTKIEEIEKVISLEDTAAILVKTSQIYEDDSETDALTLRIFSNYAEIQQAGGAVRQISIADMSKVLLSTLKVENKEERQLPGILPPSNLIYFSIEKDRILMSCYYAGGIKPMKYDTRRIGGTTIDDLTIVVPNIIISHTLNRETSTGDWLVDGKSKYMATDLPVSKLSQKFYQMPNQKERIWGLPMTNIYQDCRMCVGGNSMPARFKDNNFRGLDYYYKVLWESPFNDDLGLYACNSDNQNVSAWYKLLASLATENKPYPYERLRNWTALS